MRESRVAVWTSDRDGDIDVELFETLDQAIDNLVYFKYWLAIGETVLAVENSGGVISDRVIDECMQGRRKYLGEIVEAHRKKPPMYPFRVEARYPLIPERGGWVSVGLVRSYAEGMGRTAKLAGVIGEDRVRIVNTKTEEVEE